MVHISSAILLCHLSTHLPVCLPYLSRSTLPITIPFTDYYNMRKTRRRPTTIPKLWQTLTHNTQCKGDSNSSWGNSNIFSFITLSEKFIICLWVLLLYLHNIALNPLPAAFHASSAATVFSLNWQILSNKTKSAVNNRKRNLQIELPNHL